MNIKKAITVGFIAAVASALALDYCEVTGVNARQRYPWNGLVDIDFTLDSKATEPYLMNVMVFDNIGKTNLPVKTVYTEGISFEENPCMVHKDTTRIIWNAAADLPNGFKCTNVLVTCQDVRSMGISNLYMIVDLSGGTSAANFPVTYTNCPPTGGWTEEHMTTKLVLRRVEPGTFMMGSHEHYDPDHQSNEVLHQVELTKPYYIGIYKLTAKQASLIRGGTGTDTRPVALAWNIVRGYDLTNAVNVSVAQGQQSYYAVGGDGKATSINYTVEQSKNTLYSLSTSQTVDPSSLIGKLRLKTSLAFDLPTEAQWERACRAGSSTALNLGVENSSANASMLSGVERLDPTGSHYLYVGNYVPNAYGLYDMCGGGGEWCVDVYKANLGSTSVVDPVNKAITYESVSLYDGNVRGSYANGPHYASGTTTYNIEGVTKSVSGNHFLRLKYTAYGVSHSIRGDTARSARRASSGKTINTTGTFYTSGYYEAKGNFTNPSYQVRVALTVDE